jgi:hypothetical protein
MGTVKELVRNWIRARRAMTRSRSRAADDSTREASHDVGEYQLLHKYLRDRYADRVVLTFGEIEDLLGFSLPAPARLQQEWWDGTDPIADRSSQTDAWRLASRTARVNLSVQNVLFERHSPLK